MPFQELQIQFPVIAGNLRSFLVTLRSQSGGAKFAVAPKKFSRNFQLRWPRKGVTQTFDTNLNLVSMASLFAGCTIRAFCGRCHAELISNFVKYIFQEKFAVGFVARGSACGSMRSRVLRRKRF
jgi:hypothetical protein